MPPVSDTLPRGPVTALAITTILLFLADTLAGMGRVEVSLLTILLCALLGAGGVVTAVRLELAPGTMRRWAIRTATHVVLTLVALAIAVVAAEYATRWVFRGITTTSDFGGYFSRRWTRSGAVQENTSGYREREFAVTKPPHVYRVAVVGDSFTFGNGIPATRRFSDVMQASLPAAVEVLNFGVPGHNTPHHAEEIRERILGLHPDFVLVQWYVNDPEGLSANGRPTTTPLLPFPEWHRRLYASSALYTLANAQWTRRQVSAQMGGTYVDYMRRRLGDPAAPDTVADRRAMEDIVLLCQRAGVGVGFVAFPDSAYPLGTDYPFAYLHDRVIAFCDDHGLPCVDLRSTFATVKHREELWASPLDPHPSAKANLMAAVAILQKFGPLWTGRAPS